MIIDIDEPRLVVISDLHLGSPSSNAAAMLPAFVDHVADRGWPLCINGDAVDLLQFSVPRLVADVAAVLGALRRFEARGGRIYYVLGNHDLVLEHVLDGLSMNVSPLLNVRSGDARIRIEHGHVWEPAFMRAPGVYEFLGRISRPFLLVSGDIYRHYARIQRLVHERRRRRDLSAYPSYVGADALFDRGFDAVIMGHTHLPEHTVRPKGLFVNSGEWMHAHTYVRIDHGEVALCRWPDDHLPAGGEPT